tara:strand:- start:224 stop:571 length:348 start_codon:yes stop_codon:yes gene_type:complete
MHGELESLLPLESVDGEDAERRGLRVRCRVRCRLRPLERRIRIDVYTRMEDCRGGLPRKERESALVDTRGEMRVDEHSMSAAGAELLCEIEGEAVERTEQAVERTEHSQRQTPHQ